MSLKTAPYVKVTWPASAITNFGGYRVRRRAARAQALAWDLVLDQYPLDVNYTAANVQSAHLEFRDYDAGWSIAGGQWSDGYDYTITAMDKVTGIESLVAVALSTMVKQTPDLQPWAVNNGSPFLSFPLASVRLAVRGRTSLEEYEMAGRDLAVTRTPLELPTRELTVSGRFFGRTGEDQLRLWRAAAASGLAMTIHTPRGDRYVGGFDNPSDVPHDAMGIFDATGRLVETSRAPITATDINVPCGIILNGTTQYVTVPDNALINPGAGGFTAVVAGVFANAGASRYALSKGSIAAAANGYAIRTNGVANQVEGFTRGAGGAATCTATAAAAFDGNYHVLTYVDTGTAQALYLDDSSTPIATAAVARGAVTNAVALAVGADNAGASSFMALNPLQTAAYFGRALTVAEATQNAQALLGYSGVRMAANPALLLDCRDLRTWRGYGVTLTDLSAIPPVLNGTLVASPVTRGRPWDLSQLDKAYS